MISATVLCSEIVAEIECCWYSKLSYNKCSILKRPDFFLIENFRLRRLQDFLIVVRCLMYKQRSAETEG